MMKSGQLKCLPDTPGVYLFQRGRNILYIGKATSLRARVKSYFNKNLLATRGEWLVKMVDETTRVNYHPTSSVLEALILEAALIKKYQPRFNAKEKSDKSFWHVAITKEKWPRVLLTREKNLKANSQKLEAIFGPFPRPSEIKMALKIVRKIFPFRDKCQPESGKACFNYQIRLCPGVCVGGISAADYRRTIRHLKLFFSGRTKRLLGHLRQEMRKFAKAQKFERVGEIKRRIFALQHIQDVALLQTEAVMPAETGGKTFRLEAYDVAHLAGGNAVGVMVVLEDGELSSGQYRKFELRASKSGDDLGALREILERRLNHPEWLLPDLIVIDGGKMQLNLAKKVLLENNLQNIELVSVVKDEKHRAREILGAKKLAHGREKAIIRANHEAHRFATSYHRQKQGHFDPVS